MSPSFDPMLKYIWSGAVVLCLGLHALWLGLLTVGVSRNLPAESILGCLLWTTGMDLEIINPFTKARQREWDEGFSSALFCWRSAAFWNIWAELYSSGRTRDRWKARKGIVMAVVHVISLSNKRQTCPFVLVNMWRKTARRAALFHPVVSQTQTSYGDLNASVS